MHSATPSSPTGTGRYTSGTWPWETALLTRDGYTTWPVRNLLTNHPGCLSVCLCATSARECGGVQVDTEMTSLIHLAALLVTMIIMCLAYCICICS